MSHNKVFFLPAPQHPSYQRPGWHLRWNWGFLKAQFFYRPLWALKKALGLGPQVIWGQRISFLSSVRVNGPGKIILEDDLIFAGKPDLYTHSKEAEIRIGAGTFINGTRLGCRLKISIGPKCILADARLMDTDFHSLSKNRLSPEAFTKVAPIIVEENVWIAAGAAILKGVRIGKDSVIAFGSIVVSEVAAGKIVAGNPAREIGDVPH